MIYSFSFQKDIIELLLVFLTRHFNSTVYISINSIVTNLNSVTSIFTQSKFGIISPPFLLIVRTGFSHLLMGLSVPSSKAFKKMIKQLKNEIW